jgi:intracellular sulfur oxidation DsrE/DsrF family protein
MKKLSDTEKTGLISNIQTVLNDITLLKTKIDSDTSTTTLKVDVKSITADYRVYALVLPQISLLSASDRIDVIASEMETLSAKLQTRISDAQGKGVDVTAANNSLNDLNAKIADASSQAKIINQDVLSLTPDGGDKTKEASNTSALKDARAKLKIANNDLKTARQDVDSIVKVIKSVKEGATASTTAQ